MPQATSGRVSTTLQDLSVEQKSFLLNLRQNQVFRDLVEALREARQPRYRQSQPNPEYDLIHQAGLAEGEERFIRKLLG